MKPTREWDWGTIQSLPIGEFDWLEAKGLGGPPGQAPKIDDQKARDMLAKAISALANTGGGQFIWGAKDPDEAQGWFVENGGIPAQHGKRATGDWLEDIIPILMDAPLKGFNVYTIREAEGLAEDHVLFVIDVPDSSLAPHQNAIDHKYYGRIGGKSKPLGHRLVMDILGRRQNPELTLSWIPSVGIAQIAGQSSNHPYDIRIRFILKNEGKVTARFPALEIDEVGSLKYNQFGLDGNGYHGLIPMEKISGSKIRLFSGNADVVIFPGQELAVCHYQIVISGDEMMRVPSVGLKYKIYADGFSTNGEIVVPIERTIMQCHGKAQPF